MPQVNHPEHLDSILNEIYFEKMPFDRVKTFAPRSADLYAQSMLDVGEYDSIETPMKLAHKEVSGYFLPSGELRPNEYILLAYEFNHSEPVGILWFTLYGSPQGNFAFIAWIETFEPFRKKGIASKMLYAIEPYLKSIDVNRIDLCVFNHNTAGQKLYARTGYHFVKEKAYGNAKKPTRTDLSKRF